MVEVAGLVVRRGAVLRFVKPSFEDCVMMIYETADKFEELGRGYKIGINGGILG